MKFLLFDREENYIGNLKDVLEAKQTEEINGEDVLELAVLEQKIENISGEWGRNLLRGTSQEFETYNREHTWGDYAPYPAVHSMVSGETYTARVYLKLDGNNTKPAMLRVRTFSEDGEWSGSTDFSGNKLSPGEEGYSTVTFTFPENRVSARFFVIRFPTNELTQEVIDYKEAKLEKGPVATPWTPAPEDLDIKPQDTIEKGYKIVYKDKYGYWKEFIVKEIEESHTSDGIEKRLFCESSFYETFGDYIEDKRPSGTANHALSVALEPTRWEVGIVDNLGTDTTSFYQISAKEAVQKLAETWKGEIRTRVEVVGNKIVHRYVDILERRGGDFGQRFTYSKNLESVTKIIHRNDVVTALYGYGKGEEVGDGHGRRIDFASINDGKAYVENLEAKEVWGRPNGDGTKSHVFDKVYFDNCEDKQELLQLTAEKLEEVSSPLITYEAKAIDLGGAGLGDSVAVIDTEFTPELRLKARVIKIVRDLIEEENNDLTLGNFVPSIVDSWNKQEEFINNFRSKAGIWDRADIINNDGTINAQFLNNLVDELNQKMNSQGGYVYVSEDGKGLITYDKPIDQDPTMAIQLLGGAFRIANNKLPNGEWDWRTFGTGGGFTADEFVAGVLRGGKVHFDLTNGTFLIGDSPEDYILYFDGTTLKVRLGTGKTVEESLQDIQNYADTKASQEDVDEAISTVDTKYSNKVAEINTTIDGITQRVESTESNITTINGIVAAHNTRLESAESKITPSAIVQTVRSSTAYTNDLSGKVDTTQFESYRLQTAQLIEDRVEKDGVIAAISLSPETAKIQANKIELEGLVTANSNFKVLTDGSIEAKNADIVGKVTAESGTIGGFTIESNHLTAGTGNSKVWLGAGDNYFLYAGDSSPGIAPFSVTREGFLYAANAAIGGSISATSGNIGGWEIIGTDLYARGSDGSLVIIAPPDGSWPYILTAHDSTLTWKTRITKAGVLQARGAEITGNITAESGTIGGFTIGNSQLTAGTGSNRVWVGTASGYFLFAGSSSAGAAPFRVTRDGSLRARNADITGSITSSTISSSTITGTTITGGTVRTSSGGDRIQLSDNLLRAYESGTERVRLDTTALRFYDSNGTSGGYVSTFAGYLAINADHTIWCAQNTAVRGWLRPDTNNTYDIGDANYRWSKIYLMNNPDVISDIRLKSSVQNIPDELIGGLKEIQPKMYQQGEKWHFGYIAQDVERALYRYALKKVGWDKAKDYVKDFELLYKNESYLSLIYAEIAVLKEAEMQARIDELESKVEQLLQ